MKTTEAERQKIREVISQGLVSGLGKPVPGKMCIEAAINFAKGRPHGDVPPCVAPSDRSYAIHINDANWSSPQARAEALLPLALAQLDTVGKDRCAWASYLALNTVTRILPLILEKRWPAHAAACRGSNTLEEARKASRAAVAVAEAAYAAYTYAAYAYADADADAAAAYAAAYAADAADAAAYAADAADAAYARFGRDTYLRLSAAICFDVLLELNSPGAVWLVAHRGESHAV